MIEVCGAIAEVGADADQRVGHAINVTRRKRRR
jgi:hypothetical protein